MLEESIKSLRTVMLAIAALCIYLLVTIIKIDEEIQTHHDVEKLALAVRLLKDDASNIEIPTYDYESSSSFDERRFNNINTVTAYSLISYFLPTWFGENYCSINVYDDHTYNQRDIDIHWNNWSVFIADSECIKIDFETLTNTRRSSIELNDYQLDIDDYSDYSSFPKDFLDEKTYRLPSYLEHYWEGDIDPVSNVIDESILNCIQEYDGENLFSVCDPMYEEVEKFPHSLFKALGFSGDRIEKYEQGNLDIDAINFDHLIFLSLNLSLKNNVSNNEYKLSFSNQASSKPNIDGESFGYPGGFTFSIEGIDKGWNIDSATESLKRSYANSTGQLSNDLDEILLWVEREGENLYNENIFVPILAVNAPLSWMLTSISIILLGLLMWAYFLAKSINECTKLIPEVPWMLFAWKDFKFEKSRDCITARNFFYFLIGSAFSLFRFVIFLLPTAVIFMPFLILEKNTLAYLMPSGINIISPILAIPLITFALGVLIINNELKTSIRIIKQE